MKILLQFPRGDVGEWLLGLRAAFPGAAIAVWPDEMPTPEYALVWNPPAEIFTVVRPVKAIFNLGAGVDRLLTLPTLPAQVPVIRLEDAGMAEQMVDYVTLAVLGAYRESDVYAQQQRAAEWRPRPRIDKSTFGVGILGFGVLGRAVAKALASFGFPILAWSRSGKEAPEVTSFAGRAELPGFLARSRVLACLLPSTPETVGLLDRHTLELLPRGAHLVNVARGSILVEEDLLLLLDRGHLGGATLDVFRTEPLPFDHPFWHHPRITVTPHISAVTLVKDSIAQIVTKIRGLERGEAVTGIVDRARGY